MSIKLSNLDSLIHEAINIMLNYALTDWSSLQFGDK